MNDDQNRDLKVAGNGGVGTPTATRDQVGGERRWLWVNWILALLTVPAAIGASIFAFAAVMSTAACSDKQCPNLGPSGIGFGVLFYGAPVVALAVIAISFFTARRRWGIVVPLAGLALLAADFIIVAVTVVQ
ncbi:MAG: hypothetical protein JOZ23_12475 [Mycobacterium sp.]|nr:hypothetical protein [Mycobacterium sp.]MBV9352330.1 hypothetical protein [Mycobacterium sp.]